MIKDLRRELWASDECAAEALDWAEEHPDEVEWLAVGLSDVLEGLIPEPPPEETWRMN